MNPPIGRRLKRLFWTLFAVQGKVRWTCLKDDLLGRENLRNIQVGRFKLWVRTHTSDLDLAVRGLYHGEFDDIESEDPRVIIDAGANIGTSALFFASKYPAAKIYAIEPESGNFELLEMNTKSIPAITAIRAAIWSDDETRIVQNRHTGHWGYTVADTTDVADSTGQEIRCVTIDALMNQYGIERIDVLKMDIEGSEKEVLGNSNEWIDKVQVMAVELHERVHEGCEEAFSAASKDFSRFVRKHEKVIAYRD